MLLECVGLMQGYLTLPPDTGPGNSKHYHMQGVFCF